MQDSQAIDRSEDALRKDANQPSMIINQRLMTDRREDWRRTLGEDRTRFRP